MDSKMDYKPEKQIGVGWIDFQDEERNYIQQIMDTGRVSYGPFIQQFEKKFAEAHDSKVAMFCNSGTSALQAGLHALRLKYNYQSKQDRLTFSPDKVIVPALTFVASVNVILQNGLEPIFVDVDPTYYELDPVKVEEAILNDLRAGEGVPNYPRIRAMMPVHIGGCPADMGPLMELARKYDLQVIEDSCETMFASYEGARVGSFGDVGCFSTYVAHILTTGVGGLATTSDSDIAILIKSLFNHGRDSIYLSIDDDKGKKGEELFNIISKRFMFEEVGYSYRGTEFEGALGLAQMNRWEPNIDKRKYNAKVLTEGLHDLQDYLQLPHARPNADHVFMFYPLVCKKGVDRDSLVNFLENNLIETRYLLPLTNQPVYKKMYGDIENKYPVAKYLNNNAFYIASHPGLTDEELQYMVKVFHQYFK